MKKLDKEIICSHLLNDYSGSPFVLSQVVKTLIDNNIPVSLYIGNKKGAGFLSNINVPYSFSNYRFKKNKLLRLLALFSCQFSIFFKILLRRKRANKNIIYANTLYSFGAALAGKIRGYNVIYHIHETYISPMLLKLFLLRIVKITASKQIYVSNSHYKIGGLKKIPHEIIYNCIKENMFVEANLFDYRCKVDKKFNVTMICSLKKFKGIYEFIEIAKLLTRFEEIKFYLVLNTDNESISCFTKENKLPINLTVINHITNVIEVYKKSNLILNLSRPDEVVETFGLTILEDMSFGIPVIVPPIGGPTELVDDGDNGYLISCYETDTIAQKIIELSQNEELCLRLSKKAKEKSYRFSPEIFKTKIVALINE